jgi:hypothetical protein
LQSRDLQIEIAPIKTAKVAFKLDVASPEASFTT